VQARDTERQLLAALLKEEHAQIEAARQRLANGRRSRLSDLGTLDPHAFALFLALLGEALTAQSSPDTEVDIPSGDGLLRIRLQPLCADSHATIRTADGVFSGRDHWITITHTEASA